jgi:hypothetical protein
MLRKPLIVRAMIVALLVTGGLIAGPAPQASALVWNCHAGVYKPTNSGYAGCNAGFGSYRVRAECNTGYWPYTKTVYGAWKTRSTTQGTVNSTVNGDPHGCHIARAWVETR